MTVTDQSPLHETGRPSVDFSGVNDGEPRSGAHFAPRNGDTDVAVADAKTGLGGTHYAAEPEAVTDQNGGPEGNGGPASPNTFNISGPTTERRRGKTAFAIGTVVALFAAGGTFLLGRGGSGSATVAAQAPGMSAKSQAPPSPPASVVESPYNALNPDVADALDPTPHSGEPTLTTTINGKLIELPNVQDLTNLDRWSNSKLALLEAYLTTGDPSVLDAFSTHPNVQTGLEAFRNPAFTTALTRFPGAQVVISALKDRQPKFTQTTDNSGATVVTVSGGPIYIGVSTNPSFGSKAARNDLSGRNVFTEFRLTVDPASGAITDASIATGPQS